MQLAEYQSQPSSSHIEVPYDLEQFEAYTMSYHSVSLDYQYDDIVSPPRHVDWYINRIKSWIEAACASTYQFRRILMTLFMPMIYHPIRPFWIITRVCIF